MQKCMQSSHKIGIFTHLQIPTLYIHFPLIYHDLISKAVSFTDQGQERMGI